MSRIHYVNLNGKKVSLKEYCNQKNLNYENVRHYAQNYAQKSGLSYEEVL